jgi:multiple sugar transport system permease protein
MDRLTQALWLKSLVLFPYLLSNVLAALVWMWMLDPVLGLANVLFEAWGVGRQGFFADEDQALMTLAVVNTWKHMGMVALLFLAGLQAIPRSLYEAAALDGASGWQQFWRVTVPLLRPVLVFVWITSVTGSIQLFDTVAVATQGGPLDSTRVVVHHIVDTAFTQYRMGYATAMSWVLLLIMLAFTAVQMRLLRGSSDLG